MKELIIVLVMFYMTVLNANPLESQILPKEYDPDEYIIYGDMIIPKVFNEEITSFGITSVNSDLKNSLAN